MRTRSIVALALLCLAGAAPSLAASSETIRRETLANGLRVILVENHSKPLVAVCIVVNGGSRTETPALSGLSHYYEHLIFRGGSLKQGELEFRKQMQRIGEITQRCRSLDRRRQAHRAARRFPRCRGR